jgi:hypothetical protein
LAALGFTAKWWAEHIISWWSSDPAKATVTGFQIAGVVIGVFSVVAIFAPRVWSALRPRKFKVTFDRCRDIHAAIPMFDIGTGQRLPNRVTFVHIRVEACGSSVTACTGAITSLERLDAPGQVMARLDGTRQLIWAPREHRQFQQIVAPNLPQDLDLFRTVEGVNKLEVLSIGHPQSWLDFFDEPGRYRIAVVVQGGDMTETVSVVVDWRNKWDDFGAS